MASSDDPDVGLLFFFFCVVVFCFGDEADCDNVALLQLTEVSAALSLVEGRPGVLEAMLGEFRPLCGHRAWR